MRLGEPTSSAPSGVIVAALSPKPDARMAFAAAWTTSFRVVRRFSRLRSKRSSSTGIAERPRVQHPQGLIEQFLAGLVARRAR